MDSGPVGNEDQGAAVNNKGVVVVGGTTTSSTSNFLCRQSSTRWTPTTDQIRILKDLYYNNGVRSPTAEQIQRISAKLRQYGKIEGKNVFYWFQNHKARERQKKRFTTTTDHFNIPNNVHCYRPPPPGPGFLWNNNNNNNVNDEYHHHHHVSPVYNNKFPTTFQAGGSSTGYFNGGSMCNNGYGSMAMERSFRERSMGYNIRHHEEEEEDEEHSVAHHHAIETLPLFPMHDEIKHQTSNDYFFNSYGINAINGSGCHDWQYNRDLPVKQTATCPRASLELTLNSNGFANLNN